MSDNVNISTGSGATIGADEVTIGGTSQKLQRVKLFDATNDSTNALLISTRNAARVELQGLTNTLGISSRNAAKVELQGLTNTLGVSARNAALVEGGVAHDAAAAGNPVKIGVRARSTLAGYTSVTTNDLTEVHADVDGVLLSRMMPLSQLLTTRAVCTSAAATAFTQLNATTLVRNYVTSIGVYNHGATAVFINILNGTTAANVFYTVGGPIKGWAFAAFDPPLRQASTNTALGYKMNAAIGGSGVMVSVTGFQSSL